MEFGSVQETQITVDLSRKIEFLPKKGPIIGKNARFSVKTDAEAQILYVQREDLVYAWFYSRMVHGTKNIVRNFPTINTAKLTEKNSDF